MEIPQQVGVMVLGECTLFPQAVLPLHIFEPRYRRMLADALETHRLFCVAMQAPAVNREFPRPTAGLGLIRASFTNPNGSSNILVQGMIRVRLGRRVRLRPYRVHEFEPLLPQPEESERINALCARAHELIAVRLRLAGSGPPGPLQGFAKLADSGAPPDIEECLAALRSISDAAHLADFAAASMLTNPDARQAVLEAVGVEERLSRLVQFLMGEIEEARAD